MNNCNPELNFVDIKTLEITKTLTIPDKTKRKIYSLFTHFPNCACDLNRQDHRIPTPCHWVDHNETSKT